jgi:class 3 adenylate cyclase
LLFAHRLSKPVLDLVKGTSEIRRGNFDVQVRRRTGDELGTLAESFNEMAEGLRLKEKYRSVLRLVTDHEVAEELMTGAVQLGGEMREVSVIFCDVRGFTAMSQDMPPAEVVAMLNEHMSALTRVVHEHRGVVDKFVGDSIMTLFGAPKSYGRDAESAVRCAWQMIQARERLNAATPRELRIGIGIASGPVLAGCMGSERRLDYTVIGERVNLAARLCGAAGPMEIVIDETTRRQLPSSFAVSGLEPLALKGFSDKVTAFRVADVPARTP